LLLLLLCPQVYFANDYSDGQEIVSWAITLNKQCTAYAFLDANSFPSANTESSGLAHVSYFAEVKNKCCGQSLFPY
jgi:hypothetical protein